MPTVPEPLPPPKSLGGLLNFTEEIAEEETTISGLMERASETSEDIQKKKRSFRCNKFYRGKIGTDSADRAY